MADLGDERLRRMEDLATCYPATYRRGANCADTVALCTAVRRAWAERDAVAEEARVLREAADALVGRADEVLREYGPESHISRLSVHAARLEGALSRPRTVHAVVAEERARVCRAAQRWLARARQTKAKDDIGQDDWYSAYAEDAAALMAAVDALAEAERAARGGGEGGERE